MVNYKLVKTVIIVLNLFKVLKNIMIWYDMLLNLMKKMENIFLP